MDGGPQATELFVFTFEVSSFSPPKRRTKIKHYQNVKSRNSPHLFSLPRFIFFLQVMLNFVLII